MWILSLTQLALDPQVKCLAVATLQMMVKGLLSGANLDRFYVSLSKHLDYSCSTLSPQVRAAP